MRRRRAVTAAPTPAVLYAASRAGATEVVKAGGAQAIAALAYGTASIGKVDKLFGPGNAWVTEAKTQVSADRHGAAIDLPAGPSEVMVLADSSADPSFVASDLLSQAEHGPDSQVVLVTTDAGLARAVAGAVADQLSALERCRVAGEALAGSALLVVPDRETLFEVANRYAPEHLILAIVEPRSAIPSIRHAGSIFIGPWTPETLGDYCSGANHVLPTYGYARTYSGLGLRQFMKDITVQEASRAGLAALGPVAMELAALEGLGAHANAVALRLESERPDGVPG